jgi:phage terminase large subunit
MNLASRFAGTPVGDAIADYQAARLGTGRLGNEPPLPEEDFIAEPPSYEDERQTVFTAAELHLVPTDSFTRGLPDGGVEVLYRPASEKHVAYHASSIPNLIMEGSRGTGKSHTMRWDMHIRSMSYAGFKYLMLRRTMPELRKSHLLYLEDEMEKLGGRALGVRSGNVEAHYPNKSIGLFGHCEADTDVMKYLSAQFDAICFDEITTFEWDMVTKIKTSCRVTKNSGLTAIVRGGTNPLGVSAEDVYRYFIGRDIPKEEDPNYVASDWGNLHIERTDNPHLDYAQYDKQFVGLPEAYRKAWQDGQWGVEGAYFTLESRHFIPTMPVIHGAAGPLSEARVATNWPWLHIYRVLDWGWHDPCVCVWIAVLPDGHKIPFMEWSTLRTPAPQVADEINRLSEGMKIITTIADPTLWDGEKEMGHCLADEFELKGVWLTKGVNNRTNAGYSIQNRLNNNLKDGLPEMLFIQDENGNSPTPTLIRTMKAMRVDKARPGRIADHKADHMPIALGYFAQAEIGRCTIPNQDVEKKFLTRKVGRVILGAKQVRRKSY